MFADLHEGILAEFASAQDVIQDPFNDDAPLVHRALDLTAGVCGRCRAVCDRAFCDACRRTKNEAAKRAVAKAKQADRAAWRARKAAYNARYRAKRKAQHEQAA